MITNLSDFVEFEMSFEERYDDPTTLIKNNLTIPKVALEYYVMSSYHKKMCKETLQDFFKTYNLDMNGQYDFPTDSGKPTTLLNSLCESRRFSEIKIVLNLGADVNIQDTIGYTPFQSLLSGHSSNDIGENHQEIKEVIQIMLNCGLKPVLEMWQKEEHYLPYVEKDIFFEEFLKNIVVIENRNN